MDIEIKEMKKAIKKAKESESFIQWRWQQSDITFVPPPTKNSQPNGEASSTREDISLSSSVVIFSFSSELDDEQKDGEE